ncbi:pilin [Nocardiopsis sp. EMB25]|uniref:hypothetical protein n=1 Tax=Nocardiopsis sp. EMB25 TaxID=2835867 RepID=UPI0022837EA4|nr:hypothetical protein [Nocardiopsis sp. EMB25]MCY9785193.1 pilin [Nocardiopsis sp. EMB25]
MRTRGAHTPQRSIQWRWAAVALAAVGVAVWWVMVGEDASWAWATDTENAGEGGGEATGAGQSTAELRQVVDRVRLVLIALASALGTLFLSIAGVRWLVANGEPGQIDGAKRALSGAAIGYGIAVLATVLMDVLNWIVAVGGGGE